MSCESNIVQENDPSDEEGDEVMVLEPEEGSNADSSISIPVKSKQKYEKAYIKFMEWRTETKNDTFEEEILLTYFNELSKKYKPSSLWATHSMLRSIIFAYHRININGYTELLAFLKTQSKGFVSKKAKVLSASQIKTFLKDASDDRYLGIKVALIFGVQGGCKRQELCNITVKNIIDKGDLILVHLPKVQTDKPRSFVISGEFYNIYKKYAILRPPGMTTPRFFLNYRNGRCTSQVIGINTFGGIPKIVATYLELENPEQYTGHTFRKTSAFLLDAGEDLLSVGEGAVEEDWEPGIRTLICSAHFADNKKSEHPLNPSYLPTIFPPRTHRNINHKRNVYPAKKTQKVTDDDDPLKIDPADRIKIWNQMKKRDKNAQSVEIDDDDKNQTIVPDEIEADSNECEDELETNHKRKKLKAGDPPEKSDWDDVFIKIENEEIEVPSETEEILEEIEIKNEFVVKVEDESLDEEIMNIDEIENNDDENTANSDSKILVMSRSKKRVHQAATPIKIDQNKVETLQVKNQKNSQIIKTLKGGKVLIKTNAIKSPVPDSNSSESPAPVMIDNDAATDNKLPGTKIIKAKIPRLSLKSGKITPENIVMLRKALKLKPNDKITIASMNDNEANLKQANADSNDSNDDKKSSQFSVDVENSLEFFVHNDKRDVGCQVINSDEDLDDDDEEPSFFICNRFNGEKQCDVEVHVKIIDRKTVRNEGKNNKKNDATEVSGFIGLNSIQSDSQLKSLSNLDLHQFMHLENFMPKYGGIKMHKGNRLLILLMKLKTGVDFTALGTLFGMSESTAQSIFYTVLETLALKLNKFINWPSKLDIQTTLPEMFRKKYRYARAVADTMEIEVVLPKDQEKLDAFSTLELPNKIKKKFLFACSPDGRITFVSKCYENRVNDGFILKDSGFLAFLEPTDLVLTNDGFPCIKIHIQNKGAIMIMPPFAHDEEFPPNENDTDTVDSNDNMPTVKDHIQSCANRIRQFEILSKINDELHPHLDSIIKVICALINFQRAKYDAH